MASQPDTDRPLRADARRNRERLLAAAGQVFAEAGPGASLEAVAKRAGVGIGTLYRHFPTREALVEEAYRQEVEQLVTAARELLEELPPDAALEAWMDRFLDYVGAKRGMADALQAAAASGSTVHTGGRARILEALAGLLDAGIAAGTIRPDADADVVLRAMMGVWAMTERPGWIDQARKLLGLVLDGLRFGAGR